MRAIQLTASVAVLAGLALHFASAAPGPGTDDAAAEPLATTEQTQPGADAPPDALVPALDLQPEQPADAWEGPACVGCGDEGYGSGHHVLPVPGDAALRTLVAAYADQPLDHTSLTAEGSPLEELLFHGPHTRRYLARAGSGPLDAEHLALLEDELARIHAVVAVRVVDAEGVERLRLDPTHVPLREKRHIEFDQITDLQPLALSGTIVRVGLDHCWARY
jgi:hypothetical protein